MSIQKNIEREVLRRVSTGQGADEAASAVMAEFRAAMAEDPALARRWEEETSASEDDEAASELGGGKGDRPEAGTGGVAAHAAPRAGGSAAPHGPGAQGPAAAARGAAPLPAERRLPGDPGGSAPVGGEVERLPHRNQEQLEEFVGLMVAALEAGALLGISATVFLPGGVQQVEILDAQQRLRAKDALAKKLLTMHLRELGLSRVGVPEPEELRPPPAPTPLREFERTDTPDGGVVDKESGLWVPRPI